MTLAHELDLARRLTIQGGQLALRYFRSGGFDVTDKADDHGPVTTADHEVDALLTAALADAFPDDGILAEESEGAVASRSGRVWIIDPIDGTSDFVAGRDEFAVMIGLAIDGDARLGVIHRPALRTTHWGVIGQGAWCQLGDDAPFPIATSAVSDPAAASLMRSRAHPTDVVERARRALNITRWQRMGSFGLKSCEIASGRAELYLSLNHRTALWDTAAASAIVRAAGGRISDIHGHDLDYADADAGADPYHHLGLIVSNSLVHDAALQVARELAPLAGLEIS